MDSFEAPPLRKNNTYHIVAQDEIDPIKDPLAATSPIHSSAPIVLERPMSSASSQSSTTLQDKRQSTKSLRDMYRRRKKPLAGDRLLQSFSRVPLFIKGVTIISVTGLPFAVFTALAFTIYAGQCIGNDELLVTYESFAVYLDIAWAILLIIIALAESVARFSSWLCRLSSRTTKYASMANTMWFRVTMMLWIGAMRLATCQMWPASMMGEYQRNWVRGLRLVLEFLAIAAFILLVQGTLLQIIAVQYVQGYIGPRSEHAVNELETLQRLNHLICPRMVDNKSQIFSNMFRKIFMPPKDDLFDAIRKGQSSDAEVRGYAAILWTTVAGARSTITMIDIYEHLIAMNRDTDGAADLFDLLDGSGDGIANRQEFEDLVAQIATQLKKRAAAMQGISLLLGKLEIMFTLMVIAAITFVYTAFFKDSASSHLSSLWGGIVALAFLIAGPVADLVHSCVWVFARHSYDVGDRIEVMGRTFEVRQIFLTHTNFEELHGDKKLAVQISHVKLSAEPLINLTRSEDPMGGYMSSHRSTMYV